MFEIKALRRICGPMREEETEVGENYILKSFILYTLHQILRSDRWNMQHAGKGREYLGDLGIVSRIKLKLIIKK
jgi:hypothetical protein